MDVLVLEVAIPAGQEFWERPALELFQLLLGGSDLDTSINTIRGKRASAVDIPLVEHSVLGLLVTSDEVIKRLDMWLGTVGCKSQVVILEVETDTREVDQGLDTSLRYSRFCQRMRQVWSTGWVSPCEASLGHRCQIAGG